MVEIGSIKIPARITITADGLPEALGVADFNIQLTVTGRPSPVNDDNNYLFSFDTTNVRQSMAHALRKAADSLESPPERTHVPSQLNFTGESEAR